MFTRIDMKTPRTYTMTTRAEAVEATRRSIMQAAWDLQTQKLLASISLDDIAERAGVSVQTVLRQFGNRTQLFEAAMAYGAAVVSEERRTTPGDIDGAVRVIVDHYELRGDGVILMLAQERDQEAIAKITDHGRGLHRDWVRDVFAPQLDMSPATEREALIDLLVVATDVYTWKLLRRDRGHSRGATEQRIRRLLDAILSGADKES
jgi:AcrR family transcriptional regulator